MTTKYYLTQLMLRATQRRGVQPVIFCESREISYKEMSRRVARLAAALQALGVKPGDRVGLLALNSERFVEAMFAVWWAGAVLNPINIRWAPSEIAYSLDDCDTRVLFVDQAFMGMLPMLRQQSQSLQTCIQLDAAESNERALGAEALIKENGPVPDARRGDEDLAGVFYTGGTTGQPKGVMLSHAALFTNALISQADLPVDESNVLLMCAPLFHLAGLSFLMRALMSSCQMVILPFFSPLGVCEAVALHKVSMFFAVPVMLQMLVDHPEVKSYNFNSVSIIGYGGSPIAEALLDRAFEVFPRASFVQGYGMTELSAGVSTLPAAYHTPDGRVAGLLRSAGRALPGVSLRVVNAFDEDVPIGESGELLVCSPAVMQGYWNRPKETSAALRDGWMHTGDVARINEHGFVFIVDRLKDMIISGGENVYCTEVENVIARHPAVAAVAVIGVPSEQWGESVHAVVMPKSGATVSPDEIIELCRTHLGGYKCPRSVEIRTELPLSGAGKILKHVLRAPYWQSQIREVA